MEERFWKRVNKQGPVHLELGTNCWVWIGYLNDSGYGILTLNKKDIRAHVYSWTLANGEVKDRKWVLHKCDNRACCNPEHLFLGDNDTNVADMVAKGRQQRGEKHSAAIFTNKTVSYIKKRYRQWSRKNGIAAIARDLGVKYDTVRAITRGVNWKHIV